MIREFHLTKIDKVKIMSDLLYVFVLIFIVAWAIGYFALNAGDFIHGILIIAALALLVRALRVSRVF